jgi:uncharacterized pyridoxamine 5'-phosphate oxidase family protein
MRRIVFSAVAAAAMSAPVLFVSASAQSQVQQASSKTPSGAKDNVDVANIIREFAAKEKQFAEARNNYTYRQTVKMEECDPSGNPTGGRWEQISDIIFSPEGRRMEKVVWAPVPNLQNILLTPEDMQDLIYVQPFVLTSDDVNEYDIDYIGREKVDEIGTYVFAVKPKKMVKGKRYFAGQIWVDDRDLQIVKTYGKGVGVRHGDDQYPRFETYREQIDGKYWFPTYTHADDTLNFKDMSQRIKLVIRYQDYKHYEGKSSIKFGDVVDDKTTTTTTPPATKKK